MPYLRLSRAGKEIGSIIEGILWDRIGERGPRFEVNELHEDTLTVWMVTAGKPGPVPPEKRQLSDGELREEPEFIIRAETLDHGTPVLVYSFDSVRQLNVNPDRLTSSFLPAGLWLNTLKKALYRANEDEPILLPNGRIRTSGEIAAEFIIVSLGEKMVYATDFADSPENRKRIEKLCRGADVLFCDATFVNREMEFAKRYGHLTANTCGKIARAAAVKQLVPFHFSKRYEKDPGKVYQEVRDAFPQLSIPRFPE